MYSIKVDLGVRNKKKYQNIFRISLILVVVTFIFGMSTESHSEFINHAMAAPLSGVTVIPTSNIVNERSTYDILFTTKTTSTIKTIVIKFPADFRIDKARLVERSGIESGSLSSSGTQLNYTISNAVSVPSKTTIRLEVGKIIATTPDNSFMVNVSTLNTVGGTIDGPTSSGVFPIKSITGDDVSPNFMIRKTLNDDDAGHAHGWDPNGSTKSFAIFDSDISGASDSEFISVMIRYANLAYCTASPGDTGLFVVHCDTPPVDSAVLDYIITKLPANVVTSTDTSTFKSSSTPSPTSLQDIVSSAKHDDIASEFP